VIGILAIAAASATQCPAENGHYVLRHVPDVSAHFREVDSGPDWPSGLALAVRSKKSGLVTWWLPWNGGTNNLQNLASTTDVSAPGWRPPNPDGGPRPLGNRQFLALDADYNIMPSVPRLGRPAPAHFLIPESGSSGDRVFPEKQFFDLVSCSADAG
jgi:hypothetical protein